jgi:hypothetical protein
MKKVITNDCNKIEFFISYDNSNLIEEYITKIRKKFDIIGIDYTKEPTKRVFNGNEIDLLRITINIEFPVLKHNGWTYYGTIESVSIIDENEKNIGYENILYSTIKDNDILKKYINLENFRCDHCNTNHARKTVHLFKHEDNREFIIGTACSKEYFGINVYTQLLKILNLFPKISDFMEEMEEKYGYHNGTLYFNKNEFCKLVYGIIKEQGKYVSVSSVSEFSSEVPTSSIAQSIYYAKEGTFYNKKIEILKSLQDINIIDKVREYWLSKESEDVFIHNVQTALRMLNPREGLIAYAVWLYMCDVEDFTGKKKFGEKVRQSNFIGTIGDKIKGKEVEIYNFTSFETDYGLMFVISMISEQNEVIVWKTSSPIGEKGDKKMIKTAIIKGHTEYKDIKQTIVKNLKFEEIS